jgi:lysophospholipase L1-like esterase
MTTVVLIGDSIRMGYESAVRRELAGVAEVWTPEENGGTSANVLLHLDKWVVKRRPDIVHVNCGLHDLARSFGSGVPRVDLAQYANNVKAIAGRILAETGAALIWATTTPVNERRHRATKDFDRFEADVDAYNAAAIAVAGTLRVRVNDLYAEVMRSERDRLLLADGVHFSEEGYALLGRAVSDAIRAEMAGTPL